MPGFVLQSATGTSATTLTITAAANGNTLIFFIAASATASRTVSSLTCTNVTWSKLVGTLNGTTFDCEIWMGKVSGGSSGTSITIAMSGGAPTVACTALEFSGTVSIKDGTGTTNTGSSTSPSTGAYSTGESLELVLSCAGYLNGTAPTGLPGGIWTAATFAKNSTTCGVQPCYALNGPRGSVSASFTITSANWVTCVVAVKAPILPDKYHPLPNQPLFDIKDNVPY